MMISQSRNPSHYTTLTAISQMDPSAFLNPVGSLKAEGCQMHIDCCNHVDGWFVNLATMHPSYDLESLVFLGYRVFV